MNAASSLNLYQSIAHHICGKRYQLHLLVREPSNDTAVLRLENTDHFHFERTRKRGVLNAFYY